MVSESPVSAYFFMQEFVEARYQQPTVGSLVHGQLVSCDTTEHNTRTDRLARSFGHAWRRLHECIPKVVGADTAYGDHRAARSQNTRN